MGRVENLYTSADRKDQFGDAHGALRQAPQYQHENGLSTSAADVDKYFDALVESSTTKRVVLEELVKANAALTSTNTELLASVDSLIKANEQLLCQVGKRRTRNNHTFEDSPAPLPKTLCPHWNIKVMYAPDNYFEQEKTLPDAPGGGKVVYDDGGYLI